MNRLCTEPGYRGRFAPSPTGALHLGSVIAALASFLQARSLGGEWHVRIDDVDAPRAVRGAGASILRELERLGLCWDGPVVYQSARTKHYQDALDQLACNGQTFPCACTRGEIGKGPYPGRCRAGLPAGRNRRSVRVHAHATAPIEVDDLLQGRTRIDLSTTLGDFIVKRADGLCAYHLATVVDDRELAVSEIVRGADLLESTAAQIFLSERLGFGLPRYAHVPIAVTRSGVKLSKASAAAPTSGHDASSILRAALRFLGQDTTQLAQCDSVPQLVSEASKRWTLSRVPRCYSATEPDKQSES